MTTNEIKTVTNLSHFIVYGAFSLQRSTSWVG